jgi:hypothetical protein
MIGSSNVQVAEPRLARNWDKVRCAITCVRQTGSNRIVLSARLNLIEAPGIDEAVDSAVVVMRCHRWMAKNFCRSGRDCGWEFLKVQRFYKHDAA